MCVFTDDGVLVDAGAGEGLRGFRVFLAAGDHTPGAFSSPVQMRRHWDAVRLADGTWFIDGLSQTKGATYNYGRPVHDVRQHGQGFYVVDDPADAQGNGVLLAVRPAGDCVRHERPGGWRATSLVVEGSVVFQAPHGLAEAVRILRADGSGRLNDLATRLEQAGCYQPAGGQVAPAWLRTVTLPFPSARLEAEAARWASRDGSQLFPAMYYYTARVDGRVIVRVPDGETAEQVNPYLARVQDPDAPRMLADYVADVVAERLGASSARLVLESKWQHDVDHALIVARALDAVGATVPTAVVPPVSVAWTHAQLLNACQEAERRYRRAIRPVRKARQDRERFGRDLERRLRRDPATVVDWLREQAADVRKREGIVRSADAQSVKVKHAGETWSVTNYGPDIVRFEIVARGSHVNVYARWAGGKWHPCGTEFSDCRSVGWYGMSYDHRRGPLLARILGQKWELVHLTWEETGGSRYDMRALLPSSTVARIQRERKRAQARVRQLAGA